MKHFKADMQIDWANQYVPLEPLLATEGPLTPDPKRPPRHDPFCNCKSCLDLLAAMDIYLKKKKSIERNGF